MLRKFVKVICLLDLQLKMLRDPFLICSVEVYKFEFANFQFPI